MFRAIVHRYHLWQFRRRDKHHLRSAHWPTLRKHFLEKHPECAACGSTEHVEPHHIQPFHLAPAYELEEGNLLTACMGPNECHLRICHGGDWRAWNPYAVVNAHSARMCPERMRAIQEIARHERVY